MSYLIGIFGVESIEKNTDGSVNITIYDKFEKKEHKTWKIKNINIPFEFDKKWQLHIWTESTTRSYRRDSALPNFVDSISVYDNTSKQRLELYKRSTGNYTQQTEEERKFAERINTMFLDTIIAMAEKKKTR